MNMSQVFTAVMSANAVCLALAYGIFRIRKNEQDLGGIAIILLCLLFIGLAALAARSSA